MNREIVKSHRTHPGAPICDDQAHTDALINGVRLYMCVVIRVTPVGTALASHERETLERRSDSPSSSGSSSPA